MDEFRSETLKRPEGDIFYFEGGSKAGTPMIFVHGWPGAPETWKPQLKTFAGLGFRVVAAANRGYDRSVVPKDTTGYALEKVVGDLRDLLKHLNLDQAIWIGHDWGCTPVWALAAHHPELCIGVINMCVPYLTLELGIEDGLVPTVNRSVYPVDEYPYGQWDYQHFYETNFSDAVKEFDQDVDTIVRAFYRAGGRAPFGTPSPTAKVSERKSWFGEGGPSEVPLEKTVLDQEVYEALKKHLKAAGFFGACAWYYNHAVNKAYTKTSLNGGFLDLPVLFIEAKFDSVCDSALSSLSNPMRKHCRHLTECSIDAGHWVALEKPHETNAAMARWILSNLPNRWPGFWQTPLVQHVQR